MLRAVSLTRGLAEVDTVDASDFLDDGSKLQLSITIDRKDGSAVFDFNGTSSEIYGNW